MASWWRHGGVLVAPWWRHGGVMVALWWRHGGVMVASWWRHGGVMVALVYALKPQILIYLRMRWIINDTILSRMKLLPQILLIDASLFVFSNYLLCYIVVLKVSEILVYTDKRDNKFKLIYNGLLQTERSL